VLPFQVAEAVAAEMSKPNADPAIAAAALVDMSLRAGSRDNMSAMIVQFQNASAVEAAEVGEPYGKVEQEFIAGPFYQVCLVSGFMIVLSRRLLSGDLISLTFLSLSAQISVVRQYQVSSML
jgi:hypothetical protein